MLPSKLRNDVKEDLHQTFDIALREDVTYDLYAPHVPEFQLTSKWEDKDGSPSQCFQQFYVSGVKFAALAEARKYAGECAYNAFMSQAKR